MHLFSTPLIKNVHFFSINSNNKNKKEPNFSLLLSWIMTKFSFASLSDNSVGNNKLES